MPDAPVVNLSVTDTANGDVPIGIGAVLLGVEVHDMSWRSLRGVIKEQQLSCAAGCGMHGKLDPAGHHGGAQVSIKYVFRRANNSNSHV